MPRDVSSSTPAAQLEDAPVPDSNDWVQYLNDGHPFYVNRRRSRLWAWVMVISEQGPYYWDRRTGETRWYMEDGYSPSWLLRPDGRYLRLSDGMIFETLDGL